MRIFLKPHASLRREPRWVFFEANVTGVVAAMMCNYNGGTLISVVHGEPRQEGLSAQSPD